MGTTLDFHSFHIEPASTMEIIHYPHPTLRYRSKPVLKMDDQLARIVAEMFELMYAAKGIGLAANQVDLPLRLFVANLKSDPNEGEELVFINPILSRPKGSDEAEEGCLSLPGVYAPVVRPAEVRVQAYNLAGELFDATVGGLLGRVIQHETDHLDGVLFIDRLTDEAEAGVQEELEGFEFEFRDLRARGAIPPDDAIRDRLTEWEQKYCLAATASK